MHGIKSSGARVFDLLCRGVVRDLHGDAAGEVPEVRSGVVFSDFLQALQLPAVQGIEKMHGGDLQHLHAIIEAVFG
jgi:hypothetical protein